MEKYKGLIKLALWIVAVIVALPVIKSAIAWVKNGSNLNAAVNDAQTQAQTLQPSLTTIRTVKIQGWAEQLNQSFSSWINRSIEVRDLLNSLYNSSEVLALSNYYQSTYSKSLLTLVKKEMSSILAPWPARWDSLKPFVKDSLI